MVNDIFLNEIENSSELLTQINLPFVLFDFDGRAIYLNRLIKNLFEIDDSSLDKRFGNGFNCAIAKEKNIVCQNSDSCRFCHINRAIKSIINNESMKKNSLISKDFYINNEKKLKHFLFHAKEVLLNGIKYIMTSFIDISFIENSRLRYESLSKIDELTGVYNRRYLFNELSNQIIQAKSRDYIFAVALLDVDNFKDINDDYGHIVGDIVIKKVAKIINLNLSVGDILGRFGGDEFIIIFPNKKPYFLKDKIADIVRDIKRIKVEDKLIKVGISGGLVSDGGLENPDKIIEQCDKLLYKAKKNGKSKIMIEVK